MLEIENRLIYMIKYPYILQVVVVKLIIYHILHTKIKWFDEYLAETGPGRWPFQGHWDMSPRSMLAICSNRNGVT